MVGTLSLSAAAVDVLGDQLQLNVRQYPFEIPRLGSTPEERERIGQQVHAELESSGLGKAGRPEPEVEDALYLLCSSEVAVAAAGLLDLQAGHRLAARVVATGEVGVVGVFDGRALRMNFMSPDDLPGVCVDLIPDAPGGEGRAVTIPAVPPAGGRHSRPGGGADEDIDAQLRAAEAIAARPKYRVGHYVVTSTGRRGRRARLPGLAWFDTDRGRYTLLSERGPEGQEVVTYAPADKPRLAERIGALLGRARAG